MSALTLAVLLLGQAAPATAPGTEVRALTVTLLDEKDQEVTDVSADDVALVENGVSRDITSFKPDRRPLSVAVLVDTSAAVGSAYRLNVVEAVVGLIARLPDGSRYALWTTGDRPTKVVDHTDDRGAAGTALRRVAPQGGNYMLDAFAEASADLKKLSREGDRTAVVAVSFMGPEFSYLDKYRSAEVAEKNAELFLSVQVDVGRRGLRDADEPELRDGPPGARHRRPLRHHPLGDGHGHRSPEALGAPAVRLPPRLRHRPRSQEAEPRPERRPPGHEGPPAERLVAGGLRRRALNGRRRDPMKMTKTKRLLALALAAATAPAPLGAQARPQAPIFGTGIEIINLSLSVTDTQSNFVTSLGQNDFAVFEDGIRQQLSLFTHENLPISLVLMIDTSASMEEKLGTAQTAAIRFTKTLRPQDLAQVVQFNDRATTLQPFTNDLAALEAAIRKTEASGPTALHNALYIALKDLMRDKKAAELRRRAIVLLSDGEDTASLVTDEQVLELAKKSEINIYAISLRPSRAQDRERQAFSQAEYLVNALTRETGGRAYFPSSIGELDSVYDRIAEELRTLYSIGYVSANARRDGKWRRIVVRVPEREGLTVRHKLGYYAPRG